MVTQLTHLITSAKEVTYSSDSVCVCVQNISRSYEWIFMKFCKEVECGPGRNQLDFSGDLDSFVDPGSFPRILYQQTTEHKLTLCSVSQQVMSE